MGTKYHVEKRLFLNRDKSMSGFIVAMVEDTTHLSDDDNTARTGGYIHLSLSDCNRKIYFSFDLEDRFERAASLYKIRRMAKVINAFKDALEKEAEAIRKRPKLKNKENKQ